MEVTSMACESSPTSINWREWSDDIFQIAEKEDKLILLNIGASWCHWCHIMERTTYCDAQVIRIVNEKFIPIKVDADKHPDLQDKYLLGGWPTTAFLVPDGRMLTGSTYIPPEAMINKLKEVDDLYHQQKELVSRQVSSMAAEAEYERPSVEEPTPTLNGGTIKALENVLKQEFDARNGGFGAEPKFIFPDAMRFAFIRYRKTGDQELLNIALRTLDATIKLMDPVWGGFYRYAMRADWSQPHYEKLLYVQAGVMDNFLEAYQVGGENKYKEAASGIKSYIANFLSDQEKGGFYGSQDADVGSHGDGAQLITGDRYFPRSNKERLAMGIPYVDKTIYSDWNGMMISAYLRLYAVTGDASARDFAKKSIDRILADNFSTGHMCHYTEDGCRAGGFLSDQVYFAQALVDWYQASGERSYLTKAENLVGFMIAELQDVVDGGFYFQAFLPHGMGESLERRKPFDENAAAVKLLVQLYYITGYKNYLDLAERTLRAIRYPQIRESIIGMEFGVALEWATTEPLHIILVGRPDDAETKEMFATSLHAYSPIKVVQLMAPSETPVTIGEATYKADEYPAAYVCVQNMCTPPVPSNHELKKVLEDILPRAGMSA